MIYKYFTQTVVGWLLAPCIAAQATAPASGKCTAVCNNLTAESQLSTVWEPSLETAGHLKPIIENCRPNPDTVCGLSNNDPKMWNALHWWDPKTGSHDLCEAEVNLSITATNFCSEADASFRYLLFLDLDGDGVMETVVNSEQTGANGLGWNSINFGNALNPNYEGGEPRQFDFRPVPDDQKFGFTLRVTTNGNKKTAGVYWNTPKSNTYSVLPRLPYGRHKIVWFVNDGCGNEETCEWVFVIKDCKAPTVTCKGFSVNIQPTKTIKITAADVMLSTFDNYLPIDLIQTGIRRKGQGSGFPTLPNGEPQRTITFTCSDIGAQEIERWGRDLEGNADFCIAKINILDNINICNSPAVSVAGWIKTEEGLGLSSANVRMVVSLPAGVPPYELNLQTDKDGYFNFHNLVMLNSSYEITPLKDDNPLNGVTSFDLVLINRHILGTQPLSSPYKMIAADANNSRSITTFDMLELRKLILGLYTKLPAVPSWRFVPADFEFPDTINPLKTGFLETIGFTGVQAERLSENFIAIKVGDVNGNATTNATATEERTHGTAFLALEERQVRAGEIFTVGFQPEDVEAAYQFTLTHPTLELLDILPGEGLTREHFAVFGPEHSITAAMDAPVGFALQFRALRDGALSQMLHLSSHITRAEAYDADGRPSALALRFRQGQEPAAEAAYELFQNTPNPVRSFTTIAFQLPRPTEATLTISDAEGRIVKRIKGHYPAGLNSIVLQKAELPAGILFYQLNTPTHSATRRMLVIQE